MALRPTPHHEIGEAIDVVGAQIEAVMAPFADELAGLDTIPGVNQRTAEVLIVT